VKDEQYNEIREAILVEVCQRTGDRGEAARLAFDRAIDLADYLPGSSHRANLLLAVRDLSDLDVRTIRESSSSIAVLKLVYAIEQYRKADTREANEAIFRAMMGRRRVSTIPPAPVPPPMDEDVPLVEREEVNVELTDQVRAKIWEAADELEPRR
jgi:hypothetical protein